MPVPCLAPRLVGEAEEVRVEGGLLMDRDKASPLATSMKVLLTRLEREGVAHSLES